jgi:hypothetical protein
VRKKIILYDLKIYWIFDWIIIIREIEMNWKINLNSWWSTVNFERLWSYSPQKYYNELTANSEEVIEFESKHLKSVEWFFELWIGSYYSRIFYWNSNKSDYPTPLHEWILMNTSHEWTVINCRFLYNYYRWSKEEVIGVRIAEYAIWSRRIDSDF